MKKLTGMPKALHAGRQIKIGGVSWIVRDAYSTKVYGSADIQRTVILVRTDHKH